MNRINIGIGEMLVSIFTDKWRLMFVHSTWTKTNWTEVTYIDLRQVDPVIANFLYTGPTGPDQTKSADFVGDPGLRPGSREKVRAGPCGSGRVRSDPVGPCSGI